MLFFQDEMSNFIGLICGLIMLLTAAKAYVMARDDNIVYWKFAAQFWLLCGAVSWLGLFKHPYPSPLNIYLDRAEVLFHTIAYGAILYFAIGTLLQKHLSPFKRTIIIALISVCMFHLHYAAGPNVVRLIGGITLISTGGILIYFFYKMNYPQKKYLCLGVSSIALCGLLTIVKATTSFPYISNQNILTATALVQLITINLYHHKLGYLLDKTGRKEYSQTKLIVFLIITVSLCGLLMKYKIDEKKNTFSDRPKRITTKLSRTNCVISHLQNALSCKNCSTKLQLETCQLLNGLDPHWKYYFYAKLNNNKIQQLILTNNSTPKLASIKDSIPAILNRNHWRNSTHFKFYPKMKHCHQMSTIAISRIHNYRKDGNHYWVVLSAPYKYYKLTITSANKPILIGTALFTGLALIFWIIFDKYFILAHKFQSTAARYSELIEMQSDIIIRFSPDFRLTYFNNVFCRQCGKTREALSGMPFDDIFDLKRLKQWLLSGGQPVGMEKFILEHHWANDSICYEWQITPIYDKRNRIIEYQGVGRNISELRSVIKAHRESERKYRRLVDMAQEGIVTLDSNAIITFANQQTGKILGVEPELLKGEPILDYVIDSNQKSAWKKLIHPTDGIEEYTELVFRRKNGRKVYTNIAVTPLSLNTGQYAGLMAVIVDVSHFKQLEHDLKKVNGELKNALNLSNMILNTDPNMIYVKKRNGQIIMFNQAVSKFIGLDYSDCKAKDINKLISNYCSNNSFTETDKYVLETMKPYEFDEQVSTYLGSSYWLHTVKTPFTLPDGNMGILGITTDITSRKHAEQVLEDSNKLLETKVIRRTNSLNKTVRKLSREIREKQELQQLLQKESDRIQERLGQDLHDVLGQTLTAISIKASILSNMLDTPEQKLETEHIMEYTGKAIAQMRNISKTLSYVNVKNMGFELGMNDFINFMSSVNQVNIKLDIDSNIIASLGEESQKNLFRIAQESIINAVKHGKARNIELVIAENNINHGTLSVTSDGQGSTQTSDQSSKGIGLLIMQTRAAVMGASLKLVKNRNGCLNIFCFFPLSGYIPSRRV